MRTCRLSDDDVRQLAVACDQTVRRIERGWSNANSNGGAGPAVLQKIDRYEQLAAVCRELLDLRQREEAWEREHDGG